VASQRHELAFITPARWRSLLAMRGDLTKDLLVAKWVENGWPLIRRRAMPNEGQGVALGLPLPPFSGKRRLSFLVSPEDIVWTSQPPSLIAAINAAPSAWWPTLESVSELALRHSVEVNVFGALAWSALTGMDYLTDRSDVDLLLYVHRDTDLCDLTAEVAEIDAAAPMRLDGELIREDGAAVNWREFHGGAPEVLIKTANSVVLLDRRRFLCEGSSS
jgi:phosphoribosyl-dephospho-CoA transferase